MIKKIFFRKCPSCNEKTLHPLIFESRDYKCKGCSCEIKSMICKCKNCSREIEADLMSFTTLVVVVWVLIVHHFEISFPLKVVTLLACIFYVYFGNKISLLWSPLKVKE